MASPTTGGGNVDPAVLNLAQRQAVQMQAVEMEQVIFSQAFDPTKQLVVNVIPRNVGLIKRFRVIVTANIQNTDAAVDAVRTPFGVQNILSNVQFSDLNNYLRINTTGWHLANISTAKNQNPYGSSLQASVYKNGSGNIESTAGDYGNNYPVLVDLVGLTHGTNQNVRMVYEIPMAYSDDDYGGAVYANVVNATMNLQLTINGNSTAFVASGADDTQAILSKGTCSYNGNVTITVYQIYMDQLPTGKNGVIVPILDCSTIYEFKQTLFTPLVAGQEFPFPFSNFRDFLSNFIVYNNNGAQGHGNGSDINYFALQAANLTNIFKLDPLSVAERWRKTQSVDFPEGSYYFSYRRKPWSTTQYGNLQLILNPITAAAGNYALVGFESFGLQSILTGAGSLAAS